MAVWIMMFFSNLLIPSILISFGSLLKKDAPGQINALFGYRTARSTKNQDTWKFANNRWGKLAWKFGLWMLLGTIAAMITVFFSGEDVITAVGSVLMILQVILILITIPMVERALRKEFDENGNRRRN